MKVSTLLSTAALSVIIMGYAQANVPDPSVDLNTCLSQAQQYQGTSGFRAAATRCYALDNCNKNSSNNETALRECYLEAEDNFLSASGTPPELREGGTNPDFTSFETPPGGGGGGGGPESPVATEKANSNYDIKGGNRKGWENSRQGD
jgi:hypothetical protein